MTHANTSFTSALTQNATEFPALHAVESLKQGLQVLIALFGVVGNILVILVVRRQSRKSATDFYIQTLSVADLLVLSVNFPLAVIKERLPTNWPFGEFSCQYLYPIPDMFYGASVWTIVAIAVERYRGIVLGQPIRGKTALSRAKKISACLWALSFMVFSLPLFFFTKYEETATAKVCRLTWPLVFVQAYSTVLMLCSYAFPLACICWTYARVCRSLQSSNIFIKTMFDGRDVTISNQGGLSQTEQKRLHQNKRAHRILTPVAVLFALSMLPLTVLRTIVPFWLELHTKPFYSHLFYVVAVGAIVNSAGNPLIYCFSCEDFQAGLKELICRRKTRQRGLSTSSSSTLSGNTRTSAV